MNLIAPSTVDGMCPSVPMHCAVNLGGSGEGAVERARGPGRASGRRSQSACAPPEWTFSSGKSISLTHSLLPMPAPDATDGPDVVHRFPSFLGRCFSSLRTLPPSARPSFRLSGAAVALFFSRTQNSVCKLPRGSGGERVSLVQWSAITSTT